MSMGLDVPPIRTLIGRGPLCVIDHQDFDHFPGRNHPQSELLPERTHYRQPRLQISRAHRCRHVGCHSEELRAVIQVEVEPSGEPGLVEERAIELPPYHLHKIGHGAIEAPRAYVLSGRTFVASPRRITHSAADHP